MKCSDRKNFQKVENCTHESSKNIHFRCICLYMNNFFKTYIILKNKFNVIVGDLN